MTEPKIRFHKNDGANYSKWKPETVSTLFDKNKRKNKTVGNTNVITNSAEYGLISQRDFFDKDIANADNTDNYTIISEGDFVYNPRKSSMAPYGPFNCYQFKEDGIVSPLYTCLTPKYPEYTDYLLLYFKSSAWHRYIYNTGAQGGARHDRVGMTDDLMQGIPISLPCLEEQQKIASFFSDIDEVIAQSEAEVIALESQKKAAMQKIFSQEVRFKMDDGTDFPKWEEATINECCECLDSQRKPITKSERESGEYPYYGSTNIQDYVAGYIFEEDLVLLAEDAGPFTEYANKPIAQWATGKFWVNNHAHVLRPKHNRKFFFYSVVHKDIRIYINNPGRGKLNQEDMRKIIVPVPCDEEQQKIADFLSDFDTAIDLAKQELEKWKLLKKGLMQQMFV